VPSVAQVNSSPVATETIFPAPGMTTLFGVVTTSTMGAVL
jgi:hypothetical protein